jgi:N-acetylglucosamine-6-phosphate deacetylase
MFAICNATIYTPGKVIDNGFVVIEDHRIVEIGPASQTLPPGIELCDARGLILAPGFLDLQINGGFGHDFTADPSTIWQVAAELPRFGVTGFLPTIITSPLEKVRTARDVLTTGPPAGWRGAQPIGLHLEGPFLNPGKKGAHNPAYLRYPSLSDINGWSVENQVRLVTMAPELPWALETIGELARRGILVSSGHSLATYDEAVAGIEAGARYATHLFNAMPPLHHREPGLAAASLVDDRVTIGLIPDGLHVHPALVNLVRHIAGPDRLNLVTDAMAAMGMDPGDYLLGDYQVVVDERSARLADGTLAGCLLSLDAILRAYISFTSAPFDEALATITTTPARLLGLETSIGRIAPGLNADLVLLTPDLQVVETFIGGESIYQVPNIGLKSTIR